MAIRYDLGARDNTQDEWVNFALRQVFSDYGHYVSTHKKSKGLGKFGRTRNADADVKTTVADFQGTVVNETFVTTNIIDAAISTSANDTGIITVEGHTIDGDGNLTFVVQDVTLTGQTKKALTTPLARATRAYVKNGTFASPASDLQGVVSIYDDTGGQTAGGVPSVAAATKLRIRGDLGLNQSEKAATSISANDYYFIHKVSCGLNKTSGNTVAAGDFDLEVRQLGGVWRSVGMELILRTDSLPSDTVVFEPYIIIPPNSDVRLVVSTNTANTVAAGRFSGVLAIRDDFDYNTVS